MVKLTQKEINFLFSNLCCSRCKNDFSKDSFTIKEIENDILICNLLCQKCGKDFGEIVFNYNTKAKRHPALEIIDGPPPITTDDVIEAHRFIKNMK